MPIPKGRGEAASRFGFASFVAFFVLLAVFNLSNGDALIVSVLWLLLVTFSVRSAAQEAGGLRPYLVTLLGDVFGQRFVESDPPQVQPGAIRFGFTFRSRHFIERSIRHDLIESVEWVTGQATALMGRDMADWHVWLWFDHGDAASAEKRREYGHRKPGQDLHGVGPPAAKDRTEALGLAFVAFLRDAGVDLFQTSPTCFVRQPNRTADAVAAVATPEPSN